MWYNSGLFDVNENHLTSTNLQYRLNPQDIILGVGNKKGYLQHFVSRDKKNYVYFDM